MADAAIPASTQAALGAAKAAAEESANISIMTATQNEKDKSGPNATKRISTT